MITRFYNKQVCFFLLILINCISAHNIWMLPATKQLHPEQSENHNEEEEQEEEADDGLHGAHQRHDQVS